VFSRIGHRAGSWLLRAACLVTLFGCGVDDYQFVKEDAGPPGSTGGSGGTDPGVVTPTVCESDDDCAGLAATGICDLESGYCVECIPDREEELDRCPAGLYCDASGRCAVGCDTDADCGSLTCNPDEHHCSGCQTDDDCAAGTHCESATCVPGCAANDTCPTAWLCCVGECKNPLTDASHCGECEAACDGASECLNGLCGSPRCEPGTAECDGDVLTVCETDVLSDPNNCGKCRITCASEFCSGGTCTSVDCPLGFADCNQEEADRCETDLTTTEDCGACGTHCSDVHGEPSCTSRGCRIACDDGYDDCDEDVATGCETRLATDASRCGSCGNECKNENGSTRCVDGECSPRCEGGYGDCDGDPTNGCETNLSSSESHCGACGERCAPSHADGVCDDGVCTARCDENFADCNGDALDGCEADLRSPETCGDCANHCGSNGGSARCDAGGTCSIVCDTDRADCMNGLADGCETNVSSNVRNCGMCDHACPASVGTPACFGGVCGISTCTDPNAECDADDPMVCETNVTTDVENCGECGNPCYFPNGGAACRNRECVLTGCNAGYGDCSDTALGCETQLGTPEHCRTCAETCTNAHGANACRTNGCNPTCSTGYADCDGNPNNGCETPVTTLTDCSACGMTCSYPNATASCATGSCTFIGCTPGYGDCGAGAGCETTLGGDTNCAACGNACTNAHGTNRCQASGASFDCAPTCATGFDNCDGNPDNGCEAALDSTTDCGMCLRACTGATPYCRSGACTGTPPGLCATGGFAFCDDFEDRNVADWTVSGGTWTLGSDPSAVYVGGLDSARSTAGAASWTNQTVQARMKILHFDSATSSYRAGIVARFGGSTSYYSFQLDGAGDLRLLRGTSTVSGTGTCGTIAANLAAGTWYTLKIAATGPNNNARLVTSYSVNGTTFTPAHDCTLTSSTLSAGSAGVITVGTNTNAEFDDFAVTAP
jgi:hypothetical protein